MPSGYKPFPNECVIIDCIGRHVKPSKESNAQTVKGHFTPLLLPFLLHDLISQQCEVFLAPNIQFGTVHNERQDIILGLLDIESRNAVLEEDF